MLHSSDWFIRFCKTQIPHTARQSGQQCFRAKTSPKIHCFGAANRTIFREVPGKVVQPFTRGVDTTTLSNEVQEGQPIFFLQKFYNLCSRRNTDFREAQSCLS